MSRLAAILFLIGGTVRLVANEAVFSAFGIGELWVAEPYFIYVYKVLGAFVVLAGLCLWALAGDGGSAAVARLMKWGMVAIGAVMLSAGTAAGLALRYYLVDVVFAWLIALLVRREESRLRATAGRAN